MTPIIKDEDAMAGELKILTGNSVFSTSDDWVTLLLPRADGTHARWTIRSGMMHEVIETAISKNKLECK